MTERYRAKAGTLSILVGGDKEDFEACMPLFDDGNEHHHRGAGKGSALLATRRDRCRNASVCGGLLIAKRTGTDSM